MRTKTETTEFDGLPVIVRSNNDEPLLFGVFVGFEQFGNSRLPVVNSDGTCFFCSGVIVPDSVEMRNFLATMSNLEQWEFLRDLSKFMRFVYKGSLPPSVELT